MSLIAVGIAAGLIGAAGVTRYLSGVLFGLTPVDGRTCAVVVMGFAAVALIASHLPARRAMNVDPLVVLRYE